MSSTTLHLEALLFDMDGTLVDSTAGVVGAWELFRQTYPHIDVQDILSSAHGVRTVDNLKNFCGVQDPDLLEKEAERFEHAIVATAAQDGRQGIVILPGARSVIDELAPVTRHPNPRWAICTSATRAYATSALGMAGIPVPDVFVASEDVQQGKPFPDPYLLGAKLCGVNPENCIVFEDAPSGIRSGNAAGCKTVGLLTTHSREQVEGAKPDFIIKDLTAISVKITETGVDVTITQE